MFSGLARAKLEFHIFPPELHSARAFAFVTQILTRGGRPAASAGCAQTILSRRIIRALSPAIHADPPRVHLGSSWAGNRWSTFSQELARSKAVRNPEHARLCILQPHVGMSTRAGGPGGFAGNHVAGRKKEGGSFLPPIFKPLDGFRFNHPT